MSGSKSDYLEDKVLDHILGGPDYTRPATVYAALYHLDLHLTAGGTWHVRVEGQGAYQSADEQQLAVRESAFA